jgi:hypothetical protein
LMGKQFTAKLIKAVLFVNVKRQENKIDWGYLGWGDWKKIVEEQVIDKGLEEIASRDAS